MKTHYETLGVKFTADDYELKRSYYALAKKYHPDYEGGDGKLFAEVTEAYGVLKDPAKRKEYNHNLKRSFECCPLCRGEGMAYKQQGFARRTNIGKCTQCNGVGLVERQNG